MTDDQQDINSENTEQPKPKLKTPSKKKDLDIRDVVSFILLLLSVFIIVAHFSSSYKYNSSEPYQPFILQLQEAAAIYVAQQRTPPEVYSDFIVTTALATEPYTLSLNDINSTVVGLDTTELKLSFHPDIEATYYLDGTDVTASYNTDIKNHQTHLRISKEEHERQLNDKKEEKDQQTFYYQRISLLIFFIVIPIGLFYILRKVLKLNVLIFIIIFVVILIVIYSIPRYSGLTLKPAIYLYPTKPTNINVARDKNIDLTLDIPKYKPDIGWNVLAYPDGKIVDLQPQYTNCNDLNSNRFGMEYAKEACDKNNYPYLYWEGIPLNKPLPAQTKGWIVKTDNSKAFLESKLDFVGFNKPEKTEFSRYWAHKILESKQDTVFISFMQTEAVNNDNSLTITPTPDSLNRFYIVVDLNVKNHENPAPQELVKFKRTGFTVVDWGGTIVSLNH